MPSHRRLAVLCGALLALAAPAMAADQSYGVWRNPADSVHIRAHPCGEGMCGTVIWASDKAKADARKGGTDVLVGAQLFRDFREEKPDVWRGRVFVPDLNQVFSGTVTVVDRSRLVGKGCLLGGLVCKSQQWTRIDGGQAGR